MEETEESTTATEGYPDEDRQGIVDTLVTVMLQLVQEDPWIPIPAMLDRVTEVGPVHNRDDVLELFRGRPNVWQLAERLEAVRTAVVNNMLPELPASTRAPTNERVGWAIPGTDRYIGWRAPRVVGGGLLCQVNMISLWGRRLYRYPHEDEYTVDYMRGLDEENSDGERTDDEQYQRQTWNLTTNKNRKNRQVE